MKNAIITAATAVTGFAFGGLIGHLINRHSGKRTGGSFRETYDDNEPQNSGDSECDVPIKITDRQYWLLERALKYYHEALVEDVEFYSSPKHFNKDELDLTLEEVDEVADLIQLFHSLSTSYKGGY